MYKKILVPLDGSKLAEAALPHARALAKCMDAEIVLLRDVGVPMYTASPLSPTTTVKVYSAELIHTQVCNTLKELAIPLRADGLTVSSETCGEGLAAESILSCATRRGIDLIVMSTHGRSGVTRWLMGSVADKIVQGAKAPVLLIPPVQGDKSDEIASMRADELSADSKWIV